MWLKIAIESMDFPLTMVDLMLLITLLLNPLRTEMMLMTLRVYEDRAIVTLLASLKNNTIILLACFKLLVPVIPILLLPVR
jgi:hypothetical protein